MKRNWLFWVPRGLVILFALFTVIFSFDVFEMQVPWYKLAWGLLIHNIPFLVIMITLRLIWNRPATASILFYLLTVVFALIVRSNGHFWVPLIFTVPLLIVATLFLFEHLRKSTAS